MKKRLLSVLLLCLASSVFATHATATTLPPDVQAVYDEDGDLVKRAEQGDLEAQARLARNLMQTKSDNAWQQGFVWLKRAADSGHVYSQFGIAKMYFSGKKVPQDKQQGTAYLTRAAEADFVPAQLTLASMLANGTLLEKDAKQAGLWANRIVNNPKAPEHMKKSAQDILDSLKNG